MGFSNGFHFLCVEANIHDFFIGAQSKELFEVLEVTITPYTLTRKLTRILNSYKKLVKQFLEEFSSKLKPKEISIWKEKVDKTVEDVKIILENEKVSKF